MENQACSMTMDIYLRFFNCYIYIENKDNIHKFRQVKLTKERKELQEFCLNAINRFYK